MSGWGIGAYDFDQDGARDLFFVNSHVMDNIEQSQPHLRYRQAPALLLRRDGDFQSEATELPAIAGRGAAFGDVDNDGDVDAVIANVDGTPVLALNEGASGSWISFDLRGCGGAVAVGASVELEDSAGGKQFGYVTRAGSYLSSSDARVRFGLGDAAAVALRVVWPDGETEAFEELDGGRVHQSRRSCAGPD